MNKVCGCCQKVWTKIPRTARWLLTDDDFAGAYFDCDCGSTLFVPQAELEERMAA